MGDSDILTPLINSQDSLSSQDQISKPENTNAWGRLYPENECLKIEDLVKDNYNAGRQTNDVDFQFTKQCFSLKVMNHISKIHFIINREKIGTLGYVVFITDRSANGTFLNGEKIGKDNRWILSNNDKIAVVSKANYVYTFTDKRSDYLNCPQKVREQFAVYGILGRGTFGEVRLAFEKKTSKCFALKKVNRESCIVLREPDILSSLSHPNIVNMENFIDTTDAIYITLEYMPGGTLKQLIENTKRLKESESKIILYQVARAVQYLHNRSIAHRDLKPGNILLSIKSPTSVVKLADFGLSKKITENTHLKTFCGSLAYLAPEVFLNRKNIAQSCIKYTNKVDSWSFGVILYECLSGYKPFAGDHIEEKICKGVYNITKLKLFNTSNGAQDIIKQLLTVDYNMRFDFDKILKHIWFEKDMLMKEKVGNLIAEFSNGLKPSNKFTANKENVTKKIKFCSCLTQDTCSESEHT
ncbi:serine/threonine-protein kinase Chk2-like isoform X2 [Metopolophium dirhodum]|nr:serine/threonine-protein kinase Chk2-like isoform X2 [Metopolophium dirhodum]XP_060875680.1 serine/threonine-protein kinase Chk2-like isoform X2 [Metopolophium dirhodum]XP_060875681.1 serine/threonine-protein kinase Chk2-like isoform X2 [Metopolophium dirhodum]XP_060875682.1 serine/threonine-protein kinase Chk2-like isoform X2 [Metopolophium dirhodum]